MTRMEPIKPLTLDDFTLEQISEALSHCPEQVQGVVLGVATHLELIKRRSED